MILYLDNLQVHKARKVKEFIIPHPNIKLEFMPPDSPDMNLQEHWWLYKSKIIE
ncbi:MAG: transposase [DPANN group archaeon]|nr:transposase [DPANN group archaeon]